MSSAFCTSALVVLFITQLGSPHYREREKATKALRQITPLALPYLKVARDNPDMEIAQRSQIILSQYFIQVADRLAQETRPSNGSPLPWLDMLPQSHPGRDSIVSFYLSEAQKEIGRKGPPQWDDYRLATKLYMRQLYREQNEPGQVRHILDVMAAQERDWLQRNGNRFSSTPPIAANGKVATAR